MALNENQFEQDKLKLPASTWWIPGLTAVVLVLAVATAVS
jgi:hypothetical protein